MAVSLAPFLLRDTEILSRQYLGRKMVGKHQSDVQKWSCKSYLNLYFGQTINKASSQCTWWWVFKYTFILSISYNLALHCFSLFIFLFFFPQKISLTSTSHHSVYSAKVLISQFWIQLQRLSISISPLLDLAPQNSSHF